MVQGVPEFRVFVEQTVRYEAVVAAPTGAIAAEAFVRRIHAAMPGEQVVDSSIEWRVEPAYKQSEADS